MAQKKKNKDIERFLSAPETVRKNEREKNKYLGRKALLDAEKARLNAAKAKTKPSDEDLLNDILRVASDKNTNPYYKFKSISKRRYELFGYWPIEWITERYGQFEHAKQVAGLVEQPGTKLRNAVRASESRKEHASRYVKRYVWPHVMKDPSLSRMIKKAALWFVISDTHSTFLDPFTWQVFLSAIRDFKPDGVYINGDALECPTLSRFPKIPGWTCSLQVEFDFLREQLLQIRKEAGHEGSLVWGGGNHGVDRLAMYLTQVAPDLADLRTMRIDQLAELDGLDVTLAQGGTIASPKGKESDKRGMLLYGFYRVHHGTLLGQMPAMSELKAAGRSGTSGHAHRAQLVHGATEALEGLSWMTTPAGCTEQAARAYIKGSCVGWQKGFGMVYLYPDGDVHQYPVITDKGRATVEGYTYEQEKKFNVNLQKNWIKGLPLLG